MDSVAKANGFIDSVDVDTTTALAMDRPALELPYLFREKTKGVLENQGYMMMGCCDCSRGGGCCTCPPEDPGNGSQQLQFAAPAEYKEGFLVPSSDAMSKIPMKAEESPDLTIFTLEQKPENGNYTFELQGRRKIRIPVVVEDGALRVGTNTNR